MAVDGIHFVRLSISICEIIVEVIRLQRTELMNPSKDTIKTITLSVIFIHFQMSQDRDASKVKTRTICFPSELVLMPIN